MAYSTALALIDSFPVYNPKCFRSRLSAPSPVKEKTSMSTKCQAFTINGILGLEKKAEPNQRTSRKSLDSSPSSTDDSSPSSYWTNRISDQSEPREADGEPTTTTKKRRNRTSFSSYQIQEMKRVFAASTYLSSAMEDELIHHLGLTGKQIKTWFQNRRGKQTRERNQLSRKVQSDEQTTRQPSSSTTINTTPNRSSQPEGSLPYYQGSRLHLTPPHDLEGTWEQPTAPADSRLYRGCYGYHPYSRSVKFPGPVRHHKE